MGPFNEPHTMVQTMETVFEPPWENLTHLKIYTPDYQLLSWEQVWQAFAEVYPNRWAIEFFPPAADLVNDAHVYHLWLLTESSILPEPLNLAYRYR